jgi:hypothetical protein
MKFKKILIGLIVAAIAGSALGLFTLERGFTNSAHATNKPSTGQRTALAG